MCNRDGIHLHIRHRLADGAAVVLLVLPGRVADHTDGLFVQQAEQLQPLPVEGARDLRVAVQLPLCVACRLTLVLRHAGLAEVPEGQAGDGVVHAEGPAEGAVTPPPLTGPVLLQARRTEAVAALQDHRLLEDVAAHGAGEVHLRQREPASHVSTVKVKVSKFWSWICWTNTGIRSDHKGMRNHLETLKCRNFDGKTRLDVPFRCRVVTAVNTSCFAESLRGGGAHFLNPL